MALYVFLFIIGFISLIKGADFLVDGSASIARRLGISSLVIGLTVVAFGTSAPELVVNLIASFQGNTDLAIGNVLGSNISNTLLILGVAALIYPIAVKDSTIWKEIPFSLLAVVALFFMANDILIDGADLSQISRSDGMVMLGFFVIFVVYLFQIAKKGVLDPGLDHEHIHKESIGVSSAKILAGLVGLTLGGKWIVDGAIYFGEYMGMSQAFMGLTILAIGTSLPELATAVVAARKKHPDIIIGNVIGSNIFNILLVLATTATITPLSFSEALNHDIIMVIATTFLLFFFIVQGKGHTKNKLLKSQGVIFISIYIGYITYLVIRG
ncbi:calcium/sodium antiporter [Candidatus Peregrinibacteria bacterium]|jgi:cation:H+ antiporter|nr:calcium/sodium antiporter [Candidatus Peregrinibacteria bacterium]MBT7483263.1 calcium/sodium antiporter [Candidatus Peregrinibacteria bacterium]MBT7703364.1 calcium/sodium antiporter [Candidatus Peregrinibacteria bacterium]